MCVSEGRQQCIVFYVFSTFKAPPLRASSTRPQVVKLFGIVNSAADFTEQHLVLNGASDCFGEVFGKEVGGSHARSAIGTNTLPLGIPVEIEAIVEVNCGQNEPGL